MDPVLAPKNSAVTLKKKNLPNGPRLPPGPERKIAQPFKGSSAWITPTRIVLERKECAALIGAVAIEWTALETTLARCFAALVLGVRNGGTASDTIALESFEHITSLPNKLAVLKKAADRRFKSALATKFKNLVEECRDLHGERNDILHGTWLLSDEHPDALVWAKPLIRMGNAKVYGPKELRDILDSIEELDAKIEVLFDEEMTPVLKAVAKSEVAWFSEPEDVQEGG